MQNSELKKEILGQHKEVSARDLDRYLNGDLSADEARRIEVQLSANEFSSDAQDGFNTYGAGIDVSEAGSSWKAASKTWMLWSALGILVFISAGMWWNSSAISTVSAEKENLPKELVSEVRTNEEKETVKQIQVTDVIVNNDVKETVVENKTVESKENESVLFNGEADIEVFSVKPIQKKTGGLDLDSKSAGLKTQSARIRHYMNYKLVDQGIGIDQSLLKPLLDGTPAFSETIIVNPAFPDWVPADSVYRASMNEAIDWIIAKESKKAQMRLKRFLDNNSDDLTAAFYLGYVLFLDDKPEQALVYLDKAQKHLIQTYDHDSRFLEIKCLLQLGRDEEAKKEAEYLKNSDSFYAERALELVE